MSKKRVAIDDLVIAVKSGFDGVDENFRTVDKRFKSMDKRFESMDKRFGSMDKRFESMDKRLGELEYNLKSYLDDKLADTKGDIIAVLKGDREKDKIFKLKLLTIIKRNKLANEGELKVMLELIR